MRENSAPTSCQQCILGIGEKYEEGDGNAGCIRQNDCMYSRCSLLSERIDDM